MPCLILTGHPCSGKTTLAQLIRDVAQTHFNIPAIIVSESEAASPAATTSNSGDDLVVPPGDLLYATSAIEKSTRASLKSEFDRLVINKSSRPHEKQLVILDSMNYIKGFRYELHCISKAANERHGVVWVLNQIDIIQDWNKRALRYSEGLMNELIQRYEPPDERNRWDSPLYRIDMRPSSSDTNNKSLSSSENTSTSVAQASLQVLERSVYDMHKLSSALNQHQQVKHEGLSTITAKTQTVATDNTTNKTKAGFKRAVFKRPQQATPEAKPESALDTENPTAEAHQLATATATITTSTTAKALPSTEVDCIKSVKDQVLDMLRVFLSDENKPLKSGISTTRHEAAEANVLHTVDSVTLQVCNAIAASSLSNKTSSSSCTLSLFGENMSLHCTRTFSLAELRRLRRQYIQWATTYPPEDTTEPGVARAFLTYIETQR